MNTFQSLIQDPRRKKGVATRRKVESEIRHFFVDRNYEEVRTPLIVRSPGMETHIRPLELFPRIDSGHSLTGHERIFLPTSPEFAMKKLLAGGLEKIFQITPAFRDEPKSKTHLCEFTLLEFYETEADLSRLMEITESMVMHIALRLNGTYSIHYQNTLIDLSAGWPRFKIRDLFLEHVGVDLHVSNTPHALANECKRLGLFVNPHDTWDDLYFRIWLELVEPKLPQDRACFVYGYPASQSALAVKTKDVDGWEWSKRAEFYIGGIELGNGFEELTDSFEQRERFEKDMQLRSEIYGDAFPPSPIDEDFIRALYEGLPPCSGIAIGVDRLTLLFANETDIDYTFYLSV
ncbi:MAG: EF-P lysine aminoacylase GenX [Xanthomonadaceae bacterium]|nr:EF-P lysine aminoacylase GenX [Xanthomonadaceae bacterium]